MRQYAIYQGPGSDIVEFQNPLPILRPRLIIAFEKVIIHAPINYVANRCYLAKGRLMIRHNIYMCHPRTHETKIFYYPNFCRMPLTWSVSFGVCKRESDRTFSMWQKPQHLERIFSKNVMIRTSLSQTNNQSVSFVNMRFKKYFREIFPSERHRWIPAGKKMAKPSFTDYQWAQIL